MHRRAGVDAAVKSVIACTCPRLSSPQPGNSLINTVRSSAARLLRLWVQIPPGAWMFVCLSVVSVVCCQVEVSATG